MLEGLPPNGASVMLLLVTDEARARAVADIIVETFEPAETAAAAFEEPGGAAWAVEVFFGDTPDEELLRSLIEAATDAETAAAARLSRIEQKDWVSSALEGLQPVRAGRLLVHGSHDRRKVAVNDIGIEIEAALAFGTGHHGTTLGCLKALTSIAKRRRPRLVLDVGCGTGVLAIAAALLFRRKVACGDIDPVSVDTARANALANGAGAFVRPALASGVRHAALQGPAQASSGYDLIFANILAKPLRRLAPSLAAVAAPDAELILSGLLPRDVPGVLSAYAAHGFALLQRRDIDNWSTLILRRGRIAPLPQAR